VVTFVGEELVRGFKVLGIHGEGVLYAHGTLAELLFQIKKRKNH